MERHSKMAYAFFSPSDQPLGDFAAIASQWVLQSYIFNWKNQTFRADLILILPIAVCLGIGLWFHHPAAGRIAASGAKQSIDESRLLPLLFVVPGSQRLRSDLITPE